MDSTLVPIGQPSEPFDRYVDPDHALAYALASNDENPLYVSGEAIPPMLAVSLAWEAYMARGTRHLPPEVTEGSLVGVHGEHDLFIHQQPVPGTYVHTTGEYSAVLTNPTGMNIFVRLVTRDDDGDLLYEQFWSTYFRGPVTGGDHGTPPPDHTFPDEARSRPVGTASLYTTRDQTFRYAGASADRSAHHVDDHFGRLSGFEGKFNQGLCTLAVISRGLIDLAADGDPRRVRRIATRFSRPAFPGNDIDVSVYDIGATENGLRAFAFEADSGGQTVLKHGRVEVE